MASDAENRAFGEGSDARVAGLPRTHNPHPAGTPEARRWADGWRHAHLHYAAGVRGRWAVRPLPNAAGW